jgi:hypothetical protein
VSFKGPRVQPAGESTSRSRFFIARAVWFSEINEPVACVSATAGPTSRTSATSTGATSGDERAAHAVGVGGRGGDPGADRHHADPQAGREDAAADGDRRLPAVGADADRHSERDQRQPEREQHRAEHRERDRGPDPHRRAPVPASQEVSRAQ